MSEINVTVNDFGDKIIIDEGNGRVQHQPFDNMEVDIYFEKKHTVNLEQLVKCYIDNELRTVNKF